MSEQNKQSFPTYKGKPLVRCGDTLYYGSMKDKYVIKMDIKSKKKVGDLEVADKVTVQLMYTDPEIRLATALYFFSKVWEIPLGHGRDNSPVGG